MNTIVARKHLTDKRAAALAGTLLSGHTFDILVDDDCDVVRQDGTPLLFYRRHALSQVACRAAQTALRGAAVKTRNRGLAAGPVKTPKPNDLKVVKTGKGTRYQRILEDGSLSKTIEATEVSSGIVGSFDRSVRFPYCRQTAFTMAEPEAFRAAIPLFQEASWWFHDLLPTRWTLQMAATRETSDEFVIPGTCFTTVTVNKNWQTAVHQDAGDLKVGFGVMAGLRRGLYDGGFLCFPQFRLAVDMRTEGLVLADVHEWHGNTPMLGRSANWERISLVLYYRERMRDCGTAAEELQRAKGRRAGDPIHGKPKPLGVEVTE